MNCPKCNSDDIDQTDKLDLTVISADECRHDFKCMECGCLFTIVYKAIETLVCDDSEEDDDA